MSHGGFGRPENQAETAKWESMKQTCPVCGKPPHDCVRDLALSLVQRQEDDRPSPVVMPEHGTQRGCAWPVMLAAIVLGIEAGVWLIGRLMDGWEWW